MTRSIQILLLILSLLSLTSSQSSDPYLQVANHQLLSEDSETIIFNNGLLNEIYNETIFNEETNCRNGKLKIFNNTNADSIVVAYQNMPVLGLGDVEVVSGPNSQPKAQLFQIDATELIVKFNCPDKENNELSSENYWNKVSITILKQYSFSFLINCDPDHRHKKFQYGYLLISVINAVIIIGVAMHSHIWSIKINYRPLRYELKWIPFLIFSVVGIILIFFLYFFATNDYLEAFTTVRYFGIFVSIFFVFLCFNQTYYLKRSFRKPVYKIIRICEVLSIISTIIVILIAGFFENWIYYDILAIFICVGSIKIFHFKSLREAFISMAIMVLTVTFLAIILHFILPFSYNDYATELSSPLFIQVPDMVNNLFKKCSWLPVFDVIIPGVMLSYLRIYDENKSSKWGGVYTVSGNLAFVFSTALWVSFQLVYPFSVPFSLVTYTSLMLVIFVISWKRNDWYTLLNGFFEQGYDIIDASMLEETHKSFSKHISKSAIEQVLMDEDSQKPGSSILTNE